jgi:two-component system, chemotaxis family, protein-glutamate methylesterase/glutaminase
MARDIIVIGASYGGVAALSELIGGIDAGIPAAIFIVLHIPPESVSTLPAILSRAGGLHAFHALDGAAIEKGRIYIAPPDHHLLIKKGHMRVVHGPRENRHRPAVDPLFRSAAVAYGPRVIGVILSGYLDDGTAGLSAIKRMGGIAIAQSLDDAIEPSMPRSATRYVKVDHILPAREIGPELTRLAQMEVDVPQDFHPPEELEREVKIEELDEGVLNDDGRYGDPSAYSCPECGGVLWEIKDGEPRRGAGERLVHRHKNTGGKCHAAAAISKGLQLAFAAVALRDQDQTCRVAGGRDPPRVAQRQPRATGAGIVNWSR